MVAKENIQSILDNISLPSLIREDVVLQKKGKSYGGLCPFHEEDTPSFRVYETHYHCFGCGAHGNAVNYLTTCRHMDFKDALSFLSNLSGVPISSQNHAKQRAVNKDLTSLYAVMENATVAYTKNLASGEFTKAMDALAARGITDETRNIFRIGAVPEEWSFLTTDRSLTHASLIASGLAVKRQKTNGAYDFFRNRVMIPITDYRGRVIGFCGRNLSDEGPKYLNSPDTELFSKKNNLFGFSIALPFIEETGEAIIVEGPFDVIIPSQAGLKNIVSTCGTALTIEQFDLLSERAMKIILCFDGDNAGSKASWRAAEMLLPVISEYTEVCICRLPNGFDPDEFVRTNGIEAFNDHIKKAPSLCSYLTSEIARLASNPEAHARSLGIVAGLLKRMSSRSLAYFFKMEVCKTLQIDPKIFESIIGEFYIQQISSVDPALRNCPFCGGGGEIVSDQNGFAISCENCKIKTPVFPDQDSCFKVWNKRAPSINLQK